jgi:ferredoxin
MSDSMKVKKKDLAGLLAEWLRDYTVLTPSQSDGVARMTAWDGRDISFLDWYRNTINPVKTLFLPSVEEMFSISSTDRGHRIELPPKDDTGCLVCGVRPCDARSLTLLDTVFEDAYEDPYYLNRRRRSIIVGLGCTNPCDSCFCTSVGSGPSATAGMDIILTDIGDSLLVEDISRKGKELVAGTTILAKATRADENKANKCRLAAEKKITRKLDTTATKENLQAVFEDEGFWQQVSAKCVSCGVCTLLCPTCYCFDINDDMSGGEGSRCRSLDSCAFSVYTKMPMENPRADKWRRVRNKMCHKYEFYPMLYDNIACTGCGRCIRLCPVNWDITRVLESLPAKQESKV